jgi:hypothetical protein
MLAVAALPDANASARAPLSSSAASVRSRAARFGLEERVYSKPWELVLALVCAMET